MLREAFLPENTVFVILSFEGPDDYSLAGGLGVRVSMLSAAMAELGYETHLFFIGAPGLEGTSTDYRGLSIRHRWCQWISNYHPLGVYDGEEGKINDFTSSVPEYILENIAHPAIDNGKNLVILAEEWQTAEAMCRLSDLLAARNLLSRSILLWNANNTYSFCRIDWERLKKKAFITTVSRYMYHLIKPYGVESQVINNGIQSELTEPVQSNCCDSFKTMINADFVLFKMARFSPDKGWLQTIETAARLKYLGYRILFFIRGGIEPYGQEVLEHAYKLGLSVQDVYLNGSEIGENLRELIFAQNADVVNIKSFIPHQLSRVLFACSDAVLANSLHEPFGLVGLEAMAAGGSAYVGMTGEDYARDFENAIVLESDKAEEAVASLLYLSNHCELQQHLRDQARLTARDFTWQRIIKHKLLPKLECLGWEKLTQ